MEAHGGRKVAITNHQVNSVFLFLVGGGRWRIAINHAIDWRLL
jgi:hypothetical protein